MDVKFPLPNYLKYLDAADDGAREQGKTAFLRDVRARIKEVTTRTYIDPLSGTVDYVHLLFDAHHIIYAEGIAAESFLMDPRTAAAVPDDFGRTAHDAVYDGLDLQDTLLDRPDIADVLRKASRR